MKIRNLTNLIPYEKYIKYQENSRKKRRESIIFLEHPPTITAGTGFLENNLLLSRNDLYLKGISLHFIKRGGDFTAHEPGQLVIYPHIDLKKRNLNVTEFIRFFRGEIQSAVFKIWKIDLIENPESPGLYLKTDPIKKLVSFGIYFKSFFTGYGAAINIDNSLESFYYINPCGGSALNMTSIKQLGLDPSKKKEFIEILKNNLEGKFQI